MPNCQHGLWRQAGVTWFAEFRIPHKRSSRFDRTSSRQPARTQSPEPFDYQTAGGEYTPTESQNKAAFELLNLNPTPEQKEACNMVCMAIPVKRKYTMILYTSSMSTYGAKNKVCSESTKSNFSN